MSRGVHVGRGCPGRRAVGLRHAREVGDLVPRVAGLPQQLIRQLILRSLIVGIGGGEFSPGDLPPHLGSLFDDEGVRADVIGPV